MVGRRRVRVARRRLRRAPEDARRLIVDAAERLFAADHPEALGLKAVAHAAGVSHALITHYFGTYAGLVEAVLEKRQVALREAIVARLRATTGGPADASALLSIVFDALADPIQVRLFLWTLASERPSAADFFPLRHQGIKAIAAEVAATLAAERKVAATAIVHDVELVLLIALAAALGYNLGKRALVGALGRTPSPELDAEVRTTLAAMVTDRLRRTV